MSSRTRTLLVALAVLAVIAGGAYYWLILASEAPPPGYSLDIGEIRRLADSMPGEKPRDIRVEHVATFGYPGNIVEAGQGWSSVPLTVFAYKVEYGDGGIAMIDTGLSPRGAQDMGMTIDEDSYRHVRSALKYARLIVFTHEHEDHIGGFLASPWMELELPRAKITAEQFANLDKYNPSYRKSGFANYKPISYDRYLAVAPGIVLIKAPGHTPGSQMVFVKLADGQEFVFTGDVTWKMHNIDAVRERSRLATWLFLGEDRGKVLGELQALHDLHAAAPAIHIVPGHDLDVVGALEKKGVLIHGFTTPMGAGSYTY